jgi:hypothetical protein
MLLIWLVLAAYVYSNKKQLLNSITKQLNEGISGKLTIESMEPALLKGFPGISVSLKNVVLRDSLWSRHKHDLINAKNVYAAIDVFSAVTGNTRIRNLTVNEGSIYLFTDSTGASNTDMFKKPRAKSSKNSGAFGKKINQVFLEDVQLTIDNRFKHKLFKFAVYDLEGNIKYTGDEWDANLKINTLVQNFEFNTQKGSFMKGKRFEADLDLHYDHNKHQLQIPEQELSIGNNDFKVKAEFGFGPSDVFTLNLGAQDILLKEAAALLPPRIQSKINMYQLAKPVDIQATIRGELRRKGDPNVHASISAKDNTLKVAGETVEDCSFSGKFTNQVAGSVPIGDPNSAISLLGLEGKLYDVPFKSDSIQILNLKNPVFTGLFKSDFALSQLNKALGENFHFNSGKATLNLLFKAPYNQTAKGQRYIYGKVNVSGASLTYKPRGLTFNNANATLDFKGRDLYLENMRVNTQNTSLRMQASLLDFSNLYYTDPAKLLVDWQVQSPQINLGDFLVFLGRRKEAENKSGTTFSKKLDQLLDEANMRLRLDVNKVMYKKFAATNVRSDIVLKKAGISINNVSLDQGGGSLQINGNIDQSSSINKFHISSKLTNVDVQKLFYAFDNFGQSGITSANLRGKFFGSTNVYGSIRDNGQIVPRSFKGSVDFDIRNGSLVNFEPMQKIGSFAFPNRDFNNIQFLSLTNKLDVDGNRIVIPPMEIQSTVLNIFLGGVYSLTTGTNIAIKIPLRNPKKDERSIRKKEKSEEDLKGIVINLRAIDGEDGKVRFKLGKRAPDGYEETTGTAVKLDL